MGNDTIGTMIVASIFIGCVLTICITTIIHAILEYRQERWKLERGIKTKPHDPHDIPL